MCSSQQQEQLVKIIVDQQNYTYSKFNFFPKNLTDDGFQNIQRGELLFSAPLPASYYKFFACIFNDYKFMFHFDGEDKIFATLQTQKLECPQFKNKMRFVAKSPIAACRKCLGKFNTVKKHFFNYTRTKERKQFVNQIKQSLIEKYELLNEDIYTGSFHLFMKFDDNYISNYNGKISKLIHFENDEKVKAFEAPFTIEADPILMKIGYECGFGDEGYRGFGCVEINDY